jgi:hypothetical protein
VASVSIEAVPVGSVGGSVVADAAPAPRPSVVAAMATKRSFGKIG